MEFTEKDVKGWAEKNNNAKSFDESLKGLKEEMKRMGYVQTAFGRMKEKVKLLLCFGNNRKKWEATRMPYIRALMYRMEKNETVPSLKRKIESRQDRLMSRLDELKSVFYNIEKDKNEIRKMNEQIKEIEKHG